MHDLDTVLRQAGVLKNAYYSALKHSGHGTNIVLKRDVQ
jgi:hypothetical protein